MNKKCNLPLAIICGSLSIQAFAQQKPNVIIIIADGMQQNKMSFLGNTDLCTPSLDRLGEKGYTITNAYCTFPLSTPVRFSLLTGMYASKYHLRFNLENQKNTDKVDWTGLEAAQSNSIGYLFKRSGYDTFYGGTTSLASRTDINNPASYGFDHYYSNERHDKLGKDALSIIKSRDGMDKPYLLVLSFINPHNIGQFEDYLQKDLLDPSQITAKKREGIDRLTTHMKKLENIPEETRLADIYPLLPPNHGVMEDEPEGMPMPVSNYSEAQWKQLSWLYNRLIEEVDYNMTPVIDEIMNQNMLENTIVIFLADHGEMAASHMREHKSVPYGEAQRVPFIIAGPDICPGVIDDKTIINTGIDFLPTLCDLTGIDIPAEFPGLSVKKIIKGESSHLSRKYIFCDGPNWFQIIKNGRYKYTEIENGDNIEMILIDLKKDPDEMFNLANTRKFKSIRIKLERALHKELNSR